MARRRMGRRMTSTQELPIPPLEMRKLVGPTDVSSFDNPTGKLLIPELEPAQYRRVYDFGCGCGRVARQLIQQDPRPEHYVGADLHRGMIEWCRTNLAPRAPGFEFHHHDVFNLGFNPGPDKPSTAPLPGPDASFSLILAWSVFTHLDQDQAVHYMSECARLLEPTGVLFTTWFLFDKRYFPMMQDFQNALYINITDSSNAVIFDLQWLRRTAGEAGLVIHSVSPPAIRGFHWSVSMTHRREGVDEVEFPPDVAPLGSEPPPFASANPHQIGL